MTHSKYYVYTLAYPDGRIFYVGKGQGERLHQHEKEAKRYTYVEAVRYLPQPGNKIRVIHEIWASGGKVIKTKVFETNNEQEANKYEKQFIAQCDPRDLTNQTKGGGPQFSQRDPYARIKHRASYYSPAEAHAKLGVSSAVWRRLALANIIHFYQVDGCTLPVLERAAIDNFAQRIQDGTYPIDTWESDPNHTQTSNIAEQDTPIQPPPPQTALPKSKREMLQDAAAFALDHAQYISPLDTCRTIGSYERRVQQQEQYVLTWEIHLQIGPHQHIYTVNWQQNTFIILNIQEKKNV